MLNVFDALLTEKTIKQNIVYQVYTKLTVLPLANQGINREDDGDFIICHFVNKSF